MKIRDRIFYTKRSWRKYYIILLWFRNIMTTKFIQVSPLPPATTTSEIKSIFEAYKL